MRTYLAGDVALTYWKRDKAYYDGKQTYMPANEKRIMALAEKLAQLEKQKRYWETLSK